MAAKGGTARTAETSIWAHRDDTEEQVTAKIRAINGDLHRIRARIEKIFGTMKRSYGLSRVPHIGLNKAQLHINLTAIAYNLKRAKNIG